MESAPYPGKAERAWRDVSATVTSLDGVVLDFYRLRKPGDTAATPSLQFGPQGTNNGVTLPLKVLRDIGEGDITSGMLTVIGWVEQVEYGNPIPGQVDPLYEKYTLPMYGGRENFAAAMEEEL